VSLYQLHRCVWDYLRASATGGTNHSYRRVDASRYSLTDQERDAFERRDIAALYQLGLHPVLLNAFCRALGVSRDDYRRALAGLATPVHGKGRWQD
jgi:hypothetical protein